ncbi:protein LDOC1-like [Ambystoma mexicanum]|uniref:protein LDOC1-like n=1 Tax=Ambystoma mexicanum TaxID=8296 RepID=UPI0037E773E0
MDASVGDPVALVQAIAVLRADLTAATAAIHQRLDTIQSERHALPPDEEFRDAPSQPEPPVAPTTPAPLYVPTPFQLAAPEKFHGDPRKFRTFLNQCKLHFLCRPQAFPDSTSKAAFTLSHFMGIAATWANPLLENDSPVLYEFDRLVAEMTRVFDTRHKAQTHDLELLDLI